MTAPDVEWEAPPVDRLLAMVRWSFVQTRGMSEVDAICERLQELTAGPAAVEAGRDADAASIVDTIREADTLEEAIGLAVGGASACWDNLDGAGVFESTRAAAILDTLLELVRGYVR